MVSLDTAPGREPEGEGSRGAPDTGAPPLPFLCARVSESLREGLQGEA